VELIGRYVRDMPTISVFYGIVIAMQLHPLKPIAPLP